MYIYSIVFNIVRHTSYDSHYNTIIINKYQVMYLGTAASHK